MEWPEITNAKAENRYELVLSGTSIDKRISDHGIDPQLFTCTSLNFLRLSNTCLSSVPSEISMLHNLTSLILHTNKLSELNPEIGKLSKLKVLDVSFNQIKEIPDSFSNLTSLGALYLGSNKVEKVPNMTQLKALMILDLSCNLIEDVSELCHSGLEHLSELRLQGNKLKSIPRDIRKLSALKILSLNDNSITQVPGELGDIAKLKDLYLQGNPLSDKRFLKLVEQSKLKQTISYVRDNCPREESDSNNQKGKKGKSKNRTKHSIGDSESDDVATSKHRIVVSKSNDMCTIVRTEFVHHVRPHIMACVVKNMSLTVDSLKKFIQLQTKLHEGICEKRNAATIATHDLDLCKGQKLTFTALSPDGLRLTPLNRNKEFTGKELFSQLQAEAENFRKEKKRNAYSGIHKYLHLLEGKPLYPCLLNSENIVISFPPITNSETTKVSVNTKNVLLEVTSSTSQHVCKKVLDALLKDMVLLGIGETSEENDNVTLTVEQVRIEETEGNLVSVYPSRTDLNYEDASVSVLRE